MERSRFERPVNLEQYYEGHTPYCVGVASEVSPPSGKQMILRMLVQTPSSEGSKLSPEVQWLRPVIDQAQIFQLTHVGVRHPYTYLTVRHGEVSTTTDDEWHVDGFSIRYTHLPEANYTVVFGGLGTEYVNQAFSFPPAFDPLKHNVQTYFQHRVKTKNVLETAPAHLYFFDPYVVHRRPPTARGWRTFIRISFTPIEIPDLNNTRNPLIPTPHYTMDGVRNFRDQLLDFDQAEACLKPTNHDYAEAMNQLRDELNGREPYAAALHQRAQKIARKKLMKLVKE